MKIRIIANRFISCAVALISIMACISIGPEMLRGFNNAVINNSMDVFIQEFDNTVNNDMPYKNVFVDINGLFHRIALQREMNEVILLPNGHEHMLLEDKSDAAIKENTDSLKNFSEYLNGRNIFFFWCQNPAKVTRDDSNLLALGVVDYSNKIADEFIDNLESDGVRYLDIRECIIEDNVDQYSLFLKTEHHWNPEGGFYAFQNICDYIRAYCNEDIPEYVTNIDNYDVSEFRNSSLGYYGQRTGWMFGGFDDFNLIYPQWNTEQACYIPHKDIIRRGTFYDCIFSDDYINKEWRDRGLYDTYIGGDYPLVIHHSDTAPVDKAIIILIDSYGTIPEAFLTTVYRDVIAIDVRWIHNYAEGKTIIDYIDEYSPDVVMMALNPNQMGFENSALFDFGLSSNNDN